MGSPHAHHSLLFSSILWTPSQLVVSPKLWLNETSVVTSAAGNASDWRDISGNAWHMSQGTGANRPLIVAGGLNGFRTLRFDGTSDYMTNTSAGARAIMQNVSAGWALAVFKPLATSVDGNNLFFVPVGTSPTVTRFGLVSGNAANPNKVQLGARRLDADAGAALVGATNVGTAWTIAYVQINHGTRQGDVYVNGALDATNATLTASTGSTSNTASSTAIAVGAASNGTTPADMEIAELIVGAGSLPSAGEIDKLFGAMAHKWGLTSLLDGAHPYKTFAPTV